MIENGWCRTAINRNVARIKHVFKWAVSQEVLPSSVLQALTTVSGLRRGKSEAHESYPVKPSHRLTSTLFCPTCRHRSAMIRLELLTGMRPGEVVMMRAKDER